ncbi:MAG TPA: histone deacetylase [candidate division Zixibacteria bacterium]|nr:histone deacetylase [candidate division Zixibacteria bacterium]
MKIGLITLIQEDKHPAPAGHPENAERLQPAVEYVLQSDIADQIKSFIPPLSNTDSIFQIHSPEYLEMAKGISESGGGFLDSDTYVGTGSYEAAWETASASIGAADTIMQGDLKRIFMAVRPPGHHAEYGRGMGFCLINNVAVAAEHLLAHHGLKRVAVVDWDVHHGNGTQHTFYGREDLLFISMHRYPFYPGTGAKNECGAGDGIGFTLNIPLPPGSDDKKYLDEFNMKVIPRLTQFDPQFIIISCGFDSHRDDPLGGMNLTETAFGEMTALLVKVAEKHGEGRVLSIFEGGYNSHANGLCLYNHLKELQTD